MKHLKNKLYHQLDLAAEWDGATIVPRHPRVRISEQRNSGLAIHRRISNTGEEQRLRFLLQSVPHSHVVHVTDEYYASEFIEGECFDSFEFSADLIEPVARAFISIWRTPVKEPSFTPLAARERLIVEPLNYQELISTPNQALEITRLFSSSIAIAEEAKASSTSPDVVIHGDLKVDNLVRCPEGTVSIIDWECCGTGKIEDDLGSFIASLMFFAVIRASQAAMAHDVSAECEGTLQNELQESMRKTQVLVSCFLKRVSEDFPDMDTSALGAAVFLSLMCRVQGAIIAGASPTTVAVLQAVLLSMDKAGIQEVTSWIAGEKE